GNRSSLHRKGETWSAITSYHGGVRGDDGPIKGFVGLWRCDACAKCCVVLDGTMVFTHGGDRDEGFYDFRVSVFFLLLTWDSDSGSFLQVDKDGEGTRDLVRRYSGWWKELTYHNFGVCDFLVTCGSRTCFMVEIDDLIHDLVAA
ncbi:hypothetical protein V8G54_002198, partial [Vigna mungo]